MTRAVHAVGQLPQPTLVNGPHAFSFLHLVSLALAFLLAASPAMVRAASDGTGTGTGTGAAGVAEAAHDFSDAMTGVFVAGSILLAAPALVTGTGNVFALARSNRPRPGFYYAGLITGSINVAYGLALVIGHAVDRDSSPDYFYPIGAAHVVVGSAAILLAIWAHRQLEDSPVQGDTVAIMPILLPTPEHRVCPGLGIRFSAW